MTINFPSNPSLNDTYTFNGKVWKWNSKGWELVSTVNVADGDKGDINVSSFGATWTIDNGAVSYAKIQNITTNNRLLGRSTAGAGSTEEITVGSGLSLSEGILTTSSAYATANTPNTLALRDASGDFSAGTITASLSGNATTASTLQISRTINGVSFNGSANITITANTTSSLTFNNGGAGASSGTTFNGSSAQTISHNSIGAAPLASPTFTGVVTGASYIDLGGGVSTGECIVRVGNPRTGTGDAGVNLYTSTGGAEAARLRRYGGANSNLELLNTGTGDFYISLNGSTRFTMAPTRLAFNNGGGTSAGINALWSGSATGATSGSYHYTNPSIATDITSGYSIYASAPSTANSGSAVTLTELKHFTANSGTKGTNRTVTREFGFVAESSLTVGNTSYGFYSSIASGTGRWNFYAGANAANYFAGTIASLGSYNGTTATAANLNIAANGDILRSTSSEIYKTDVENIGHDYVDNVIYGARPVWYRSTCEADNPDWSWYGLIAEEVAELDPRLVFWGRPSKSVLLQKAQDEVLSEDGSVIQPAKQELWTDVEDTSQPLRPEGVQYDRLTVMLIDVAKRQKHQIQSLTERIEAIELAYKSVQVL